MGAGCFLGGRVGWLEDENRLGCEKESGYVEELDKLGRAVRCEDLVF